MVLNQPARTVERSNSDAISLPPGALTQFVLAAREEMMPRKLRSPDERVLAARFRGRGLGC